MDNELKIDVSKLSDDSKDFIRKLQTTSQLKYDELTRKLETNKRPLTVSHATFIIS